LLGDPGCAKSQLLKFCCGVIPRAIYTTGKGASAVGLTAGVHKDALTKEWTLEGGALVLADNGICCFAAEDHQLLTNHGFLSLSEVLLCEDPDLKFASYDQLTKQLCYEHPRHIIVKPKDTRNVVEVTDYQEKRHWASSAMSYPGLLSAHFASDEKARVVLKALGCDDNVVLATSRHMLVPLSDAFISFAPCVESAENALSGPSTGVSIIATADHDLFAQLGIEFHKHDSPMMQNYFRPGSQYIKVKARKLAEHHHNTCIKLEDKATRGLWVPRTAEMQRVIDTLFKVLSLDTEQKIVAFLEFYGSWLSCGGLSFCDSGAPHSFYLLLIQQSNSEFLVQCLNLCRVTTNLSCHCRKLLRVWEPRWVLFFFGEYWRMCNCAGSYHVRRWITSLNKLFSSHLKVRCFWTESRVAPVTKDDSSLRNQSRKDLLVVIRRFLRVRREKHEDAHLSQLVRYFDFKVFNPFEELKELDLICCRLRATVLLQCQFLDKAEAKERVYVLLSVLMKLLKRPFPVHCVNWPRHISVVPHLLLHTPSGMDDVAVTKNIVEVVSNHRKDKGLRSERDIGVLCTFLFEGIRRLSVIGLPDILFLAIAFSLKDVLAIASKSLEEHTRHLIRCTLCENFEVPTKIYTSDLTASRFDELQLQEYTLEDRSAQMPCVASMNVLDFSGLKMQERIWWAHWLTKARARAIIRGYSFADGIQPSRRILLSTTTPDFRDQLLVHALHAGYTAHFRLHRLSGIIRSVMMTTEGYEVFVKCRNSLWSVCLSSYDVKAAASFGGRKKPTAMSALHVATDVSTTRYSGCMWCATLPSTFVVVRRVKKVDGLVVYASVPTIQGNCIDEFDKMNEQDRTSIHEAMEQQSISISKAGIVTSLRARCSVIAAANPIGGQYDPSLTFSDNVELSEPILQRFDMLCALQDSIDPLLDVQLAYNVITSHQNAFHTSPAPLVARRPGTERPLQVAQDFLREYIAFSRKYCHPRLHTFQQEKVSRLYAELRLESIACGGMPIAVRHLESLMRISEAHAKMRLRDFVGNDDVDVAIEVVVRSFIGSQQRSVRRALEHGFTKYLSADHHSELLVHTIRSLLSEARWYNAETPRNVHVNNSTSPSTKDSLSVSLDDVLDQVQEYGIDESIFEEWAASELFEALKLHLDRSCRTISLCISPVSP